MDNKVIDIDWNLYFATEHYLWFSVFPFLVYHSPIKVYDISKGHRLSLGWGHWALSMEFKAK